MFKHVSKQDENKDPKEKRRIAWPGFKKSSFLGLLAVEQVVDNFFLNPLVPQPASF